jgi:hypothetical protein
MTIRIVDDVLRFIRENPGMYITQDSRSLAERIADRLAMEARLLGVADWLDRELLDWRLVASDIDWLALGRFTPPAPALLFSQVIPLFEAGQNGIRGEVVARALAKKLVTLGPDGELAFGLDDAEEQARIVATMKSLNKQRVIAFQALDADSEARAPGHDPASPRPLEAG